MTRRQFVLVLLGLSYATSVAAQSSRFRFKRHFDAYVTTDETLFAKVPFGQVPDNGFYYLSTFFGSGSLVNGTDYTHRLSALTATFPQGSLVEWAFPASGGTGLGSFAYGYPLMNYGGGYFGNPYNVVGPWPMKINLLTTLIANYDLTLGGNTNAFDMLIDLFVTTSPTSTDGTYAAEISFFPWCAQGLLTATLAQLTSKHVVTFACGECHVGIQGTQICVFPTSSSGTVTRAILSGSIDLKEIFLYLVSIGIGGLTGNEYVRGVSIGPEVQVPAVYNSAPYAGSVRYNALSYVWV